MKNLPNSNYIEKAIAILEFAREQMVKSVHHAMVFAYYELGKIIIEEEQEGKERAKYAKKTIENLSKKLKKKYGRGYSSRNLEQMRQFYLVYSKAQTLSAELQMPDFKLSWSHYLILMRIKKEAERRFYEVESSNNNWGVRELKRQFNSSLYERLVLSRDKDGVKKLSEEGQILTVPKDAIKDPYILEFLGLEEQERYSESDLEKAIIDKIEHFLLELGKGFAFVDRQQRLTLNNRHYFVVNNHSLCGTIPKRSVFFRLCIEKNAIFNPMQISILSMRKHGICKRPLAVIKKEKIQEEHILIMFPQTIL